MDKFVIRAPKPFKNLIKNDGEKILKQMKLHNLKGVVVIEDIEKSKILLERNDVESSVKIATLTKLSEKLPSKEILINTNLGKTVHKLCRDPNKDVACAAKKVYDVWKQNIISKVGKPPIEVRCDLKTQQFRDKARSLILSALKNEDSSDTNENLNDKSSEISVDSNEPVSLAEYIEREVFSVTNKKTNVSYRRTNRKIVFVLKYQTDVRTDVVKAKISVPLFVKTYFQE